MRKEIQDLRTNARIFQLSKCTACTFTLDLPAVHFMCMHSFHLRCLGDNEKECPECAPEYRSVLEMKRSLEQNSKDQDRFFQQVKNSKDGFSVIAEYFGKGIISKTSSGSTSGLRSGSASSSSGFWGLLFMPSFFSIQHQTSWDSGYWNNLITFRVFDFSITAYCAASMFWSLYFL